MKENKQFNFESKKHITHTKYFYFLNSHASKVSLKEIIKPLAVFFQLLLRKYFSIELKKVSNLGRDDRINFSCDDAIRQRQIDGLSKTLVTFFSNCNLHYTFDSAKADVVDYDNIFRSSTISDYNGGMGYNNGLFCYCFIKAVSPEVVIESGVWRGFTTLLIDKATHARCSIKSFDINLSRVEWRSQKAKYYENDLCHVDLNLKGDTFLAFFDDHVSHYDRINYCIKNNIKFIICDDDVSLETVHSDGWPPIPTANMVMNYHTIPHTFNWVSNRKKGHADISGLDCDDIISRYKYFTIPDVFQFTGYHNTSVTSFLIGV